MTQDDDACVSMGARRGTDQYFQCRMQQQRIRAAQDAADAARAQEIGARMQNAAGWLSSIGAAAPPPSRLMTCTAARQTEARCEF
jgi:hypothetical protein